MIYHHVSVMSTIKFDGTARKMVAYKNVCPQFLNYIFIKLVLMLIAFIKYINSYYAM